MNRIIALCCSLMLAGPLYAGGLDLSLSSDTAYAEFLTSTDSVSRSGADIGLGLFYTDDSDYVVTASMMIVGNSIGQRNDLEFGVGVKGYGGHLDDPDQNIFGLALGAQGRYIIPANTPMGVVGQVFFAPQITSFNDTRNIKEFNLRYEIQVVENTLGFVGYRLFETKLENPNKTYTLDDGFHIGIRLIF